MAWGAALGQLRGDFELKIFVELCAVLKNQE